MGSILSNNPSQTVQDQPIQNPVGTVNSIISRILGSDNPNETFQQLINSNPMLKSKIDEMNQYGNGDPKTAFINYMNAKSKQGLAQNIMQLFGLKF